MRFLISSLLVLTACASARAQDAAAAVDQRVEALRQQLLDVTDKQTQLQAREQQLDEDLRPENIEKSVAGIGTTDASALRDRRRQELERQKAVVDEQLRSLSESRARLETAIATAEAEAVRLRASALAPSNSPPRDNGVAAAPAPAASAASGRQSAQRGVRRRRRARARRRAPSH
jgi:chromosome segregation ATPase